MFRNNKSTRYATFFQPTQTPDSVITQANQIRGLVGEYGIVAPVGIQQLRRALPDWLEDAENGLTHEFRALLADLAADLRHLDDRIGCLDERIALCVKNEPVARRLMELRGIGPLTASALAGALGDGKAFSKGCALN